MSRDPLQPDSKGGEFLPNMPTNLRLKENRGEDSALRTEPEAILRKEVADLLVLLRPTKSFQNGAGFSRKKN